MFPRSLRRELWFWSVLARSSSRRFRIDVKIDDEKATVGEQGVDFHAEGPEAPDKYTRTLNLNFSWHRCAPRAMSVERSCPLVTMPSSVGDTVIGWASLRGFETCDFLYIC